MCSSKRVRINFQICKIYFTTSIPFKMGRVKRGIYRMRKTWFKLNNQLTPQRLRGTPLSSVPPPRYIRPTRQQLPLATLRDERGEFCHDTARIAREDCRNVMLLRPKADEMAPVDEIQLPTVKPTAATSAQPQPVSGSDQRRGRGSYRFVDVELAVELGAQAALEHQQVHPHCDGPGRPVL